MKSNIKDARKTLGRKIREIRKLKGLTQEKLGEKADLSYQYIGELERGNVNVSFDSLMKIALALDIYIGDFFRNDKEIVKIIQERSPLSRLSPPDLALIKKSLRLLNRTFAGA
ncbi:MAG: helix-turn-helix transcriptional regulator [Nitrospirae bacterium]|nr:helix-turn-helix transcriptional regulator [Nitrospirota bacterium]